MLSLLTVASVSSLVLVATLYLGKRWVEQWISHHFAAQLEEQRESAARFLEDLRHEKDRQLENYRAETTRLLARASLISDKEFDVLPVLWKGLVDALNTLGHLLAAFKVWPDVDGMNEEVLTDFVEEHLSEWTCADKCALRSKNAPFRGNFYRERLEKYQCKRAYHAARQFSDSLRHNKIFLRMALFNEMDGIDLALFHHVTSVGFCLEQGLNHEDGELLTAEYKTISTRVEQLGSQVRDTLRDFELTTPATSTPEVQVK